MRLSAVEVAQRFVDEKYPNCFTALLAGSASRGEETDTSDLDIVVFDSDVKNCYRESLIVWDWRVECFVHNDKSYLEQFDIDRGHGRATLATMISSGIIVKDSGFAARLKENADRCITAGPPPLDQDFINASRYFMRLSGKGSELSIAVLRQRQKCSLTYPKTYAQCAFLASFLARLESYRTPFRTRTLCMIPSTILRTLQVRQRQ